MSSPYQILLCFDSPISDHRQLALDYWSGCVIGERWQWDVSVKHLAELHGVAQKDIPRLVKCTAIAVNLTRRCADCDDPEVLSSRSSVASKLYGDFVCSECLQARNRARLERQEEAERKRSATHREHIAALSRRNQTFDYDEIGYADAVIAFSIMLASDQACETGLFEESDRLYLCETSSLSGDLLARLFQAGILGIAEDTHPGAVVKGDGDDWSYYPHKVRWRFASDVSGRSFPQVMKLLAEIVDGRDDEPGYANAVTELWKLLAYDDAVSHLTNEVDTYRLPDVRVGPKTNEAIWHALEHFSIPQVRREISSVVKNAAALSQRRDFDRRHALNTIPGMLISYVDRAISEGWQIFSQLRNWQNEEPVLLTVLFNRVLGTGLPGFKTLSNSLLTSTIVIANP